MLHWTGTCWNISWYMERWRWKYPFVRINEERMWRLLFWYNFRYSKSCVCKLIPVPNRIVHLLHCLSGPLLRLRLSGGRCKNSDEKFWLFWKRMRRAYEHLQLHSQFKYDYSQVWPNSAPRRLYPIRDFFYRPVSRMCWTQLVCAWSTVPTRRWNRWTICQSTYRKQGIACVIVEYQRRCNCESILKEFESQVCLYKTGFAVSCPSVLCWVTDNDKITAWRILRCVGILYPFKRKCFPTTHRFPVVGFRRESALSELNKKLAFETDCPLAP